jgi:hypothetical protein
MFDSSLFSLYTMMIRASFLVRLDNPSTFLLYVPNYL